MVECFAYNEDVIGSSPILLIINSYMIIVNNISDLISTFFSFLFNNIYLDCPVEYQTRFSDSASPTMEGIVNFHNHIMVVLCFIAVLVGWLLINCIQYYSEFSISDNTKFTHSKELEIVWTSVPALILLFLATPSFTLLYSMDEIVDPELTLKILGHQWYWGYEMSEYNTCFGDVNLQYNCYMMVLDGLPADKKGYFRLLETNRRILLPTDTHLRLLVSAADVLHSWTIPSFGIKVDACPGRLNQLNLYIKRTGLFFGQCSEICGVNHGFMPISLLAVNSFQFNSFILNRVEF